MKYKMNTIYNEDCLQAMKQMPDNYFELAIVDPPYGIGVNKMTLGSGKYKNRKKWDDKTPSKEYFDELFRISKNQIIWGANHFSMYLKPSRGWVFWDKNNGASDFSDGELAYTSFDKALKKFKFNLSQQSMTDIKNRFHPTQKPVALYEWLLKNYAKKGDKILDTHLGSGSSIIACKKLGFEYMAFELDKDYYEKTLERIKKFDSQGNLFSVINEQEGLVKTKQESLLEQL